MSGLELRPNLCPIGGRMPVLFYSQERKRQKINILPAISPYFTPFYQVLAISPNLCSLAVHQRIGAVFL